MENGFCRPCIEMYTLELPWSSPENLTLQAYQTKHFKKVFFLIKWILSDSITPTRFCLVCLRVILMCYKLYNIIKYIFTTQWEMWEERYFNTKKYHKKEQSRALFFQVSKAMTMNIWISYESFLHSDGSYSVRASFFASTDMSCCAFSNTVSLCHLSLTIISVFLQITT